MSDFQKCHYEAIAKILAEAGVGIKTRALAEETLLDVAYRLVYLFTLDNDSFDAAKFYRAAKIDQYV